MGEVNEPGPRLLDRAKIRCPFVGVSKIGWIGSPSVLLLKKNDWGVPVSRAVSVALRIQVCRERCELDRLRVAALLVLALYSPGQLRRSNATA